MQMTRHEEYIEDYRVGFHHPDGYGWSFNSDKDGNLTIDDVSPGVIMDHDLHIVRWTNLNLAIAEFMSGNYEMTIENYSHTWRYSSGNCDNCRKELETYSGIDISCDCGAQYNCFGQRLRDDWRDNPSNWDENIDDMEGYEIEMTRKGDW